MRRRLLLGLVLWVTTVRARRRAWEAQDEVDTDRFLAALREV
jgi:hypothetical protein